MKMEWESTDQHKQWLFPFLVSCKLLWALPSITFSSPKCVRGRKLGVSSACGVSGVVGDCKLGVTLILTSWWAWAPALDELGSLFMFDTCRSLAVLVDASVETLTTRPLQCLSVTYGCTSNKILSFLSTGFFFLWCQSVVFLTTSMSKYPRATSVPS